MRWFLVFYVVDGHRHDVACVRAWNRREAYYEVMHELHAAARGRYGREAKVWWDTDDDIHPAPGKESIP